MSEMTSEPTHTMQSIVLAVLIVSALILVSNYLYERMLPVQIGGGGDSKQFEGGGSVCKDISPATSGCEYTCAKSGLNSIFGICDSYQALELSDAVGPNLVSRLEVCTLATGMPIMSFSVATKGSSVTQQVRTPAAGTAACAVFEFDSPADIVSVSATAPSGLSIDRLNATYYFFNQ